MRDRNYIERDDAWCDDLWFIHVPLTFPLALRDAFFLQFCTIYKTVAQQTSGF
jgi:hypothetical protein